MPDSATDAIAPTVSLPTDRPLAIAFVASETPEAQEALDRLSAQYGQTPPSGADVIVALGGDGFMLETLHGHLEKKIPIYGMNRGTIGFLLNEYREDALADRIRTSQPVVLHPLVMTAVCMDGTRSTARAVNEVSLLRQSRQAANLRLRVDGIVRMDELICDGVLIATPAGSTAYNLSAHGPILPLGTNLLALTPISAFRPRRWRGALLPGHARITIDVLNPEKRPVSAVADYTEVRDVVSVDVTMDNHLSPVLLFDPEHNLEERILKEQFTP